MGLIQSKWNEEECREEDGVFFPNDEYIPITRKADGEFHAGVRQSVQSIVDEEPDSWADVYAACEHSNDEYTVIGGGGSWEGEGFVALVQKSNRELSWILHLQNIENVTEIVIEGEIIKATAVYYPHHNVLTIPISEPQAISINLKYET
jgi:hypothetical protein